MSRAAPSTVKPDFLDPPIEGSLGLRGLWSLIGNSTAVAIIAVMLFLSFWQVQRMHTEAMTLMDGIASREREANQRNTDALSKSIDRQAAAIAELAAEVRKLRDKP